MLTQVSLGIDYVEVRSKFTIVLTAKTFTKTLPPSTVTVQSTTVVSSTSTVVPPTVSITLSFSTTVPVTITSTFQATTTTTTTSTLIITSTSTGYDACATNNLLGPNYNGNIIEDLGSYLGAFSSSSTDSAYDCCVACLTSGNCDGTGYDTNSGTCYQINSQTCTNGQQSAGYFLYEPSNESGLSLVVSNSNCGYVIDGGVGY
jgi:hypothetical protein